MQELGHLIVNLSVIVIIIIIMSFVIIIVYSEYRLKK